MSRGCRSAAVARIGGERRRLLRQSLWLCWVGAKPASRSFGVAASTFDNNIGQMRAALVRRNAPKWPRLLNPASRGASVWRATEVRGNK